MAKPEKECTNSISLPSNTAAKVESKGCPGIDLRNLIHSVSRSRDDEGSKSHSFKGYDGV